MGGQAFLLHACFVCDTAQLTGLGFRLCVSFGPLCRALACLYFELLCSVVVGFEPLIKLIEGKKKNTKTARARRVGPIIGHDKSGTNEATFFFGQQSEVTFLFHFS